MKFYNPVTKQLLYEIPNNEIKKHHVFDLEHCWTFELEKNETDVGVYMRFEEGFAHRIGGPAKISVDQIETEADSCFVLSEHFYIKGFQYSEKEYWKLPELIEYRLNEILK